MLGKMKEIIYDVFDSKIRTILFVLYEIVIFNAFSLLEFLLANLAVLLIAVVCNLIVEKFDLENRKSK